MKEAIYKIPCKECEVVYLGETKRKLGTRTKEHFASCQKAFLSQAVHQSVKNDTGLPFHFLHSGHSFDFDKVQLVQRERNWVKRKILEALYIQTTANTCNLNSGMKFDENWLTFFQFFSSLPFSWIFFPLIFFHLYFHAFSYCCFACFPQFPISFCDRAW